MAVEYIDSPNAGFVKLGEGVGLSTITPQRKRKVKKGDRAIFPITPTGAESYETTDFRPAAGFTSPASTIPNVFDRYRTVPGGARAGGTGPESSFERVILPINPNGTNESITEDLELEEQLRRKSFDIGLDFDPSGRTDPSSPNFDAQAVADRDRQVALNENFMNLGVGFKDQVKVGIRDLVHRTTGGKAGRSLQDSLLDIELLGGDITKGIEGVTFSSDDNAGLNIDKDGKVTIGINNALSRLGIDATGPTLGGARGSVGGTGFTTNVPKASFERDEIFDPTVPGSIGGGGRGATNVFAANQIFDADTGFKGAGGAPTVESTPQLGSDISRLQEIREERANIQADIDPTPDFDVPEGAGEAAGLGADFDFGAALGFNRGGKVQSFMNMKK
jgi:hypothetical protein